MSVLKDLHSLIPLSSGSSSLTLLWKEHFLFTISSCSSDEATVPFNLLLPQPPVIKSDVDASLANQHKREVIQRFSDLGLWLMVLGKRLSF